MSGCSRSRAAEYAGVPALDSVQDTTAPPSTAAAALSGCPSNSDDNWISWAWLNGVTPACARRPLTAAKTADDGRRRRAKTTRVRNRVAAADFQAGRADTGGLQPMLNGTNDEMAGVEHKFAGALPFDLDNQTGIGCLDDDFVVETQRQPEAVEARAEVGAGSRNNRAAQQSGSQH